MSRRAAHVRMGIAVWLLSLPVHPVRADCRLEAGPQRTVTHVLDGETLRLDDGTEVRLAGLLAPRPSDAGTDVATWPSADAATAALTQLTVGKSVALGFVGQSHKDRLNRHIAQAFVIEDGRETWIQGAQLRAGHGRAYQQRDQRGCAAELFAHEDIARRDGRGLWAVAAYAPRAAARLRDLEGMAGKFAILRGRVAWVAAGRETIALGFTPSTRRAVSQRRGIVAIIDNKDKLLIESLGGVPQLLEGREVEIRGWLERRLDRPSTSLIMDVSLAGAIVTIDATTTPANDADRISNTTAP